MGRLEFASGRNPPVPRRPRRRSPPRPRMSGGLEDEEENEAEVENARFRPDTNWQGDLALKPWRVNSRAWAGGEKQLSYKIVAHRWNPPILPMFGAVAPPVGCAGMNVLSPPDLS